MLAELYRRSQGIPRLINAICDNLLLTGFALECKTTTLQMLEEVTEDMRLEWPGKRLGISRISSGSRGGSPLFSRE